MWRFIRRVVWPALESNWGRAIISLALLALTTLCSILIVDLGRTFLQLIQSPQAHLAGLGAWLSGSGAPIDTILLRSSVAAIVLPTALWIATYYRDYAFERVALAATRSLRERLFAHMVQLPYLSLIEQPSGAFLKRIVEDTEQVRALVIDAGLRRLSDLAMTVGILVYIAHLSPTFAGVAVAAVLLYFGVAYWSAGLTRGRLRLIDAAREQMAAHVGEALGRVVDVRSAAHETWESDRFAGVARHVEAIGAQGVRWLLADRSITGYLGSLGCIGVLAIGAWSATHGGIALDQLVVIVAATSMLFGPANELSAVPIMLRRVEISARNILAVLDQPTEAEVRNDPTVSPPRVAGSPILSIRDLTFAYEAGRGGVRLPALDIRAGERVAIVGRSGVGKSTLVRVIFGLLPDHEGDIRLDGVDIRATPLATLRTRISYLPQEDDLFQGTLRENVAYGARDPGSVGDDAIHRALKLAGMDEDIARFATGIDTELNQVANNLSKGQRRRLSLARVLMREPGLLILDEPFEGVSPAERGQINAAIKRLGDIATLIVTHDYDVLKGVDQVIVLEHIGGPQSVARTTETACLMVELERSDVKLV